MLDLHPSVPEIVGLAKRMLDVKRVIVFGSRARGDMRDLSDIDLAIEHDSSPADWAAFCEELEECAPTLLEIDLIDLKSAGHGLRKRIEKEGILLYGRP